MYYRILAIATVIASASSSVCCSETRRYNEFTKEVDRCAARLFIMGGHVRRYKAEFGRYPEDLEKLREKGYSVTKEQILHYNYLGYPDKSGFSTDEWTEIVVAHDIVTNHSFEPTLSHERDLINVLFTDGRVTTLKRDRLQDLLRLRDSLISGVTRKQNSVIP